MITTIWHHGTKLFLFLTGRQKEDSKQETGAPDMWELIAEGTQEQRSGEKGKTGAGVTQSFKPICKSSL